jgi:hypothetical protein
MSKVIAELIDICMKLESEMMRLFAIGLAYCSPSEVRKIFGAEIPPKRRSELKEEGNNLGGFNIVMKRHSQVSEEYCNSLSELSEFLEEEGFEVNKFKEHLSEPQFSWMMSKIGEIKKRLKGIEII